ncbi:hypothetical protein [Bifidobacterium sp. ESL0790]|uniref:hypothetical protein n=1 Tax=Bifidobacterium sp. ESL0790 TaxID=2983233 RepID=UPI0023F7095E|nr:hypothetical protein [Bifidobacterium sp. ESL0790]WEV71938.1 hypothetical protein OZY47_05650 [Bifidobacterium sp. ESL0790]
MEFNGESQSNSNLEAVRRAQADFEGDAQEAGLRDEDDLMELIKEIRKERAVRLWTE